ncbi:MAG: M24 family metallopeptidase, partial [Chloroflexota bacterium]
SFALLNSLAEAISEIEIEGEFNNTIFDEAQKTKSREEIERIREIGVKTSNVMRQAIEFIQSHYEKDGFIVKQDQTPLTIGEVKRHVLKALFEVGLEDPEGMIFSIGRDAGVPHSKGESDSPIRIGESVVFDLFPRESGGGYFHDMTRTFSIGSARDDVQETFDQVKFCYDKIVDSLQVDELASRYQHMTCDIFEELGHETIRSNPKVENGYVHSLGHGLGIELHSHPRFSTLETNQDRLVPGSVFTIEPGLYYPDRGFGVRLEDVWTLNHDGEFECLTDFPKELVIKLTGSPDVGGIHRTN